MVLLPGPLEKYYFPKQNLPDWKLGTILMRFLFFSLQGTEYLTFRIRGSTVKKPLYYTYYY